MKRLESHALANVDSKIPLFFAEEDAARLLRHPPPFGYQFPRVTLASVRARQRNATVPTERRFRSCAVVGNSGTLRLRKLGHEIDQHDAVFRVNHAPPPQQSGGKQLVPWTGERTTWRIVTSRWFDEAKRDPSQRILAVCDRPFIYSCQNILFENGPVRLVHNVNPRFYAAVRRQAGKSRIPLAGLVATGLALRTCDSVDVYGLSTMQHDERRKPGAPRVCGYYWTCSGAPGLHSDRAYHSRPGDAEFHDFPATAATLLRWNRSGAVSIKVRRRL